MFKKKVIILFLVMLLVVKLYLTFNKEDFFSSPTPSPHESEHSSPHESEHSSPHESEHSSPHESEHSSPHESEHSSPHESGHSSPHESENIRMEITQGESSRKIKGVEILFNCNDCNLKDFSEMEKRDIINNILNRFNKLDIENVEFKSGYLRVLLFLDMSDIDIDYIHDMVNSIKKDKLEIIIRNYTLTSFDIKLIYEHDEDYKLNLNSGCNSHGRNNRDNLNEFMDVLKKVMKVRM